MNRVAGIALALLMPLVAASSEMTDRAVLQGVPVIPGTSRDAYEMYVDQNASLTQGPALQKAETSIKNAMVRNTPGPAGMSSDQQRQMATAQQMQQRMASGQMDLNQMMAMAQQMNSANSGYVGPVSDHDQKMLKRIDQGGETSAAFNDKSSEMIQEEGALMDQWEAEDRNSHEAEDRETGALRIECPGEAGGPSPAKVYAIKSKHAEERIGIATRYLKKEQELEHTMRIEVGALVDQLDGNVAAWAQIENPGLKKQFDPQVHAALNSGLTGVSMVQDLVVKATQRAAQTVADKKRLDRDYKGASC